MCLQKISGTEWGETLLLYVTCANTSVLIGGGSPVSTNMVLSSVDFDLI